MLIKKTKVASGIITRKTLTGPIEVSADLTRKCTLDCLMCWWWSPLVKKRPSLKWANQEMDYELFKELIQDLKKIRVKRIILGGQGEPFLYSKLLEAIEITKEAGIEVALITSGFFLNEKKIRAIFDLRIDCIDISLQAATAETYLKIHPGQKEDTFKRIKNQLILLSKLKESFNRMVPKVRIIHVICNLNYQETVEVIELAKEVGADSIGFKRIDVIPETRELLLNNDQLRELKSLLKKAKGKSIKLGIKTSIGFYQKYIVDGLTTGVYTHNYYSNVPCYVGWLSSRILSDGNIIPCCGCYDTILGNIHNDSFAGVWSSEKYQQFRQKSINIQKDSEFVQNCKCYSCIDFEFNLGVYKRLHPIKAKRSLYG